MYQIMISEWLICKHKALTKYLLVYISVWQPAATHFTQSLIESLMVKIADRRYTSVWQPSLLNP